MVTVNLGLEQPEYLSDGETAVDSVNDNFSTIDVIIDNLFVHDGDLVTSNGSLLTVYKYNN